jgi:ribosomal protein L32E
MRIEMVPRRLWDRKPAYCPWIHHAARNNRQQYGSLRDQRRTRRRKTRKPIISYDLAYLRRPHPNGLSQCLIADQKKLLSFVSRTDTEQWLNCDDRNQIIRYAQLKVIKFLPINEQKFPLSVETSTTAIGSKNSRSVPLQYTTANYGPRRSLGRSWPLLSLTS